jgi:plastocyanin
MRVPRRLAVAMGALLITALWGPGTALAVTSPFIVTADRPAAVPSGHNWSFDDFFPRTFSVHRQRVVEFKVQGFHTATLLPKGMTVGQDRNRQRIERVDADDTTRNINGTRKATLEVAALLPTSNACGSASSPCTFNGTSIVSSGAPLGPSGPFYVKVTAPVGTYSFLCRVHPGMNGSLTVVSAGAHATSDVERTARVRAQIRADRQEGFVAEAAANRAGVFRNADGTRTWVLTAGTGTAHTAVLEMLPRNVNIRKGDRVAWRTPEINEPHTVTFPDEQFSDLVAKCEQSGGVDSDAAPLHFPPQGPFDFGCGTPPAPPPDEIELGGGNGVRSITSPSTISDSGWMQSHAMDTALHLPFDAARSTWSVRFATTAVPGTYRYMCQLHGDAMEGFIHIP